MIDHSSVPFFPYSDEAHHVQSLLAALPWPEALAQATSARTKAMVETIRKTAPKSGELEAFLQHYKLTSHEGRALMALAEALLRVPDAPTADALIDDKILQADWFSALKSKSDWRVKATGLGLTLTQKTLESLVGRLGRLAIRRALKRAMKIMGQQFVLGRTITEGLSRAKPYRKGGYRPSFDMLGEGARTADDAQRYFDSYRAAIEAVGQATKFESATHPTMSVKLSALHPRYEYRQRAQCVPVVQERLIALCRLAASYDIGLTVDAEEADRLLLSLEVIEAAISDSETYGWNRFGMAVQAYDKRCFALIDYIEDRAQTHGRRMGVRLVKGAYWDYEIKRAQILGLETYPVFTRKRNTDLSWLACAYKLLQKRGWLYPMFATHNAFSMAAVLEMAGDNRRGFEFQRLHGMGEALHDLVIKDEKIGSGMYAPVGPHEELLPYLVRRLLENGASSSFVYQLHDPAIPAADLAEDQITPLWDCTPGEHVHPKIPLPQTIYGAGRKNAPGSDLQDKIVQEALIPALQKTVYGHSFEAAPFIGGKVHVDSVPLDVVNPAQPSDVVGKVWPTSAGQVVAAFKTARSGFDPWHRTAAAVRADHLDRLADLLEQEPNRLLLIGLLVREAGRTLDDALSEWREAIDFCRYYAVQGRRVFDESGTKLDGPTGEENILTHHGRGVFVCISPWNFPLAIFLGQIAAALMAGNAVIAKPAEQTPLIAMAVARLILKAGIPPYVFTVLPGAGDVGAALVTHPDVAGVAFTGSTETARAINRALAAKDGPIVPLIAETGGQNAMIVDSSALPEQIVDDVILSAFGSAGQRCSALRVLYVQDDIADFLIEMLKGAMATRHVGDPGQLSTDIGPVIDEEALAILQKHRAFLEENATLIGEIALPDHLDHKEGFFFAPCAYEIKTIKQLDREVFGPILHVIRYKAKQLDQVIADINATGYGLTFGFHSRIGARAAALSRAVQAGNCYVNRSMIGAVVGCQPFGGNGLSGTGPKAGGPHYLARFATEKVVATDITRQGGNATLVSLE